MSEEGSDQGKNGQDKKKQFDVVSDDTPLEEPDGGMKGNPTEYHWKDRLNECDADGNVVSPDVGTADFQGTVDGNKITCTGTIHLPRGTGWTGDVDLEGTLKLVDGEVGDGDLTVKRSNTNPTPPFSKVHVSKVNPKRYKTV